MNIAYTVDLSIHNHADRLARTLSDVAALHMPQASWEFLVIDNDSRDSTAELLARHIWPKGSQVRVVREDELGLSNAGNRAIAETRGEYVIFMDPDETPDPDWLCAYERLIWLEHPDAFGSRIRVLFEDDRPSWLSDELLGFLGELKRADSIVPLTDLRSSFHGGNFGVRKTVCETIGPFDAMPGRKCSDNRGGEDVDFYRRLLAAGFRVWWTPDAAIHHRIEAGKLDRRYFHDLHHRMGRMAAIRRRGQGSRVPPPNLFGQLLRAISAVWQQRLEHGRDATVRREMNVAYFVGQIGGWAFGPRLGGD